MRPHACPGCGAVLDTTRCVSDAGDPPPRPGDFTVCQYCATPCQFTGDMGIEPVSVSLLPPEDAVGVLEAVMAVRKRISSNHVTGGST